MFFPIPCVLMVAQLRGCKRSLSKAGFPSRCASSWILWLVGSEGHGARIGLEQERLAFRPGAQQLPILIGPEIARPHDTGCVGLGGVPDPLLLENVERRVAHEDQQFAGN